MKYFLAVITLFSLVGCATYNPVPANYAGTVASVTDTGFSEDGTKAQVFVLMEVDGHEVNNSVRASAGASYGHGFALTTKYVSRDVPAEPMKVKIKGTHITGAPIQALFGQVAGTFFSAEGVVDFNPVAGGDYVVTGELSKEGSSVWIADIKTKQPVTEKIVSK